MNIRRHTCLSSIGEKITGAMNVLDAETLAKLEAHPYNGPLPSGSTTVMHFNEKGFSMVTKDALAASVEDLDVLGMITCDDSMRLKRFDNEQRSAEFIASTDAVDAHGDVIDQGSWVLNHFQANPIILYGHNSKELPIGQATAVSVVNGKLMATIKFASAEANPKAEQVWKLIQEGILRAVSVGFQPTDGRYEMRNGDEVFVWRSPILKEISVVPVPANHEALARMKSAIRELQKEGAEHPNVLLALLHKFKHAKTGVIQHPEVSLPAAPAVTATKSGAPPRKEEESTMDPKELAAKIEKQAGTIATLEADAKKHLDRAEKADAQVIELSSKVKALETDKAALEGQTKALAGERDAEKARADKLEDEVIEREVDALVNVKISAAEKEGQIKLRKSNPTLFKELMAQRAETNLSKQIVKDPPNASSHTAADALADEFKKK